MEIRKIVSNRGFEKRTWWDIVYRWENNISKEFDVPIRSLNLFHFALKIGSNIIYSCLPNLLTPTLLRFVMTARPKYYGEFGKREIPVFIDFYLRDDDAKRFLQTIRKQKLVLITSKEVYDYLIELGGDRQKIKHWALSLPDEFAISPKTKFEKNFDLVLMGRLPKTFQNYLTRYKEAHPDFSIVTKKVEDGQFNYYDREGKYVGNANNYEGYIDLLRKSKVYIYTTPGLDRDKATKGFSQVTPRFLEVLSCGCNLIMHYPDNSDTEYYELSKFGKSISSYEEFEGVMDEALKTEPDMRLRSEYLKKHYTSTRSKELKKIINEFQ